MDHVVGQILVQVGEAVGVPRKGVVLPAQPVSSGHFAETHQIHHVECRDVIGTVTEVGLPVARLPEPEALHLQARVTEWRVTVRGSFQVQIHQLLQVRAHYLQGDQLSILEELLHAFKHLFEG